LVVHNAEDRLLVRRTITKRPVDGLVVVGAVQLVKDGETIENPFTKLVIIGVCSLQ